MSVQPQYVGTTPTLTDTILDANGQAVDLTGATVTLDYRPPDSSSPIVGLTATPNADQVNFMGVVTIVLGGAFMSAPQDWVCWWHVVFSGGADLETDNFIIPVITHGPGGGSDNPYLTSSQFRALTRVKQSRLGIAWGQPNAELLLQTELTRAAAYVEFVTGQPAMDTTMTLQATMSATLSTASLSSLLMQAIQMRTEQVTFQSQNSYVDDATDDVVTTFSVGGYSQSKTDPTRRGEEKSLNTWQALANVLWACMTPDRFYFWEAFLSSDPTIGFGAQYSFENTFEPSAGMLGFLGGAWGYGFGGADELLQIEVGAGIGGWQGGLGGLPGGIFPLPVD